MRIATINLVVAAILLPAICNAQSGQIKGFTEPYRAIEIAASEMGTLSQVMVAEGDHIQSGTIVANLNEQVLAASWAMAKESSRAQGTLNSAKAELDMQTKKHDKLLGLFKRRHASQTEVDRAQTQLEVAQAKVESAEDDLRIKSLEVRRIEAQLEQRRLRSPIDGIVTQVFKEEGEFVSANDPVVVTVVQLDPLLAVFSVPQAQASSIKKGQTMAIQIEGVTGTTDGFVEFVSPTADAQSGTSRVKIRIPNAAQELASGRACYLWGTTHGNSQLTRSNGDSRSIFKQTSSSR